MGCPGNIHSGLIHEDKDNIMLNPKRSLTTLLLTGALLFSTGVASASTSFDFTSQSLNPGSANSGGSLSMTEGGITVTETAWWVNANNSGSTVTGTSNDFARTWLGAYSGNGLGVCNPNEQSGCSSPQHQIDNYSGMDFVLLGFNAAVSLGDLGVQNYGNPKGTGSADVDMSYAVLSSAQESSLLAGTLAFSSLTFTTDLGSGSSASYNLNTTGQYVLIGTAVTKYYGDGTSGSATPDAFKIQNLSVTSLSATPEPSTFLLIAPLMAGFFGLRRFRRTH